MIGEYTSSDSIRNIAITRLMVLLLKQILMHK
jgi:hypothetical protein